MGDIDQSAAEINELYARLDALRELDTRVIYPRLPQTTSEATRDGCFWGLYRRARANVESLLTLRKVEDYLTLTRLTRSLFELIIELKLLDVIPDAVHKIQAFSRLEQLRSARKIVAYASVHPKKQIDSHAQVRFIAENTVEIENECKRTWLTGDQVEHWSGMTVKDGVALLVEPTLEIIDVRFPNIRWHTNADSLLGLTLASSSYIAFASEHIRLACEFYALLLESVSSEFCLPKEDLATLRARTKDSR